MLNYLNFSFAREQAIDIARDRIAHLTAAEKTQALEFIDLSLQEWKFKRADDQGTIEIDACATGQGLLGWSHLLGPMAEDRPKRVPVAVLRPDECAGPWVKSSADLLLKLWAENYERTATFLDAVGIDIALALLVERDGKTMPIDSLASAVRTIWTFVWLLGKTYKKMLLEAGRKKAAQTAAAQARSVVVKKQAKEERIATLRKMAADIVRSEPGVPPADIAARLHVTVHEWRGYEKLSVAGITRRIGGVREETLRSLNTLQHR